MVSLPTESNTTEPQQPQTQDNADESQYKLVNRVLNYPTVSSALETAKGYYEAAKESSTIVKSVAETVESGVDTTMKTLQPAVTAVMDRSQPILASLDNMGMHQLDRLEKLQETYQPSVVALAEDLKTKATLIAETGIKKVEPIDQYLKSSYLAAPINIAVDSAENIANRYLPEHKSESSDAPVDESGPIFRSGKLAMRMQKEALVKLQNLTLRDAKTTLGYTYVVDLIQYAASNLDSGMENTKHLVADSIEASKEKARALIDSPTLQQTKDQVTQRSQDAMLAIQAALELISKQIPENVLTTSHQVIDQAKVLSLKLEESNMSVYSAVAAKSAEKLREMGSSITTAVQNAANGPLPHNIMESARSTLTGILENLMSARETSSTTTTTITTTVETSTN